MPCCVSARSALGLHRPTRRESVPFRRSADLSASQHWGPLATRDLYVVGLADGVTSVQQEQLAGQLGSAGAFVVGYIPADAWLVLAKPSVSTLLATSTFAELGSYLPSYKIAPEWSRMNNATGVPGGFGSITSGTTQLVLIQVHFPELTPEQLSKAGFDAADYLPAAAAVQDWSVAIAALVDDDGDCRPQLSPSAGKLLVAACPQVRPPARRDPLRPRLFCFLAAAVLLRLPFPSSADTPLRRTPWFFAVTPPCGCLTPLLYPTPSRPVLSAHIFLSLYNLSSRSLPPPRPPCTTAAAL